MAALWQGAWLGRLLLAIAWRGNACALFGRCLCLEMSPACRSSAGKYCQSCRFVAATKQARLTVTADAQCAVQGNPIVCCSSPERFMRLDRAGTLEARPIKGTAARHTDPSQDAAAAEQLRASEKDRAENLMIVDLLRNDLGRVCEPGSVHVPGLMQARLVADACLPGSISRLGSHCVPCGVHATTSRVWLVRFVQSWRATGAPTRL